MSEKTTAKEVKQIHNDNEEVWKLSNIERSELAKSRNLLITNLANKMNSSQNVLFSFALLNANIEDDFAESEFERYLSEEEKNEISDKIYERQEAEIEGGLWQDFDLDR